MNFKSALDSWKVENLQGFIHYEHAAVPVVKTELTNEDGTVVAEISQGRIGRHLAEGDTSAKAYRGEWEPFLRRLAEDFANTTPIRGDIAGEIRLQGYMQAEFGHIRYYLAKPEMELARGYCDFCLFPERVYSGDVRDSYIIELKYSKPGAGEAEIAAKAAEGIAQLKRYASDRFVPELAAGTRLHCLLYQFQGTALIRAEEIAV